MAKSVKDILTKVVSAHSKQIDEQRQKMENIKTNMTEAAAVAKRLRDAKA